MCIGMLSLCSYIIEDCILAVLVVPAVEGQKRGMLPVLQLGSVYCVLRAKITCYNCYKTLNLCGKYSCKIIINNRNKVLLTAAVSKYVLISC